MIVPREEFRALLGDEAREISDEQLRQLQLEAEALARIIFDVLVGERRRATQNPERR